MIHRLYSDMPTFKNLEFGPNFNLLLADKSAGATDRQTRNRAGKTSVIELIHFLLGSNSDKTSMFRNNALSEYSFGIDFDLQTDRVVVERSGSNPSKIFVIEGNIEAWPVKAIVDKPSGHPVISNAAWRSILGLLMFEINVSSDDEPMSRFGPTFRSLFAYFVRRQLAGAFTSPIKQADMQQIGDYQVALSYLLGLDWSIPQQWQTIREKEKMFRELRKVAGEGTLGSFIGTTAALRTRLTVVEERSRRLKESIESFHILPEYHNLEQQASDMTRKLGSLADDNTVDRQLVSDLEHSLEDETMPLFEDLERLYKEVGVVLPWSYPGLVALPRIV